MPCLKQEKGQVIGVQRTLVRIVVLLLLFAALLWLLLLLPLFHCPYGCFVSDCYDMLSVTDGNRVCVCVCASGEGSAVVGHHIVVSVSVSFRLAVSWPLMRTL